MTQPPPSLKAITPYLARGGEGIAAMQEGAIDEDGKSYLMELMSAVEAEKGGLEIPDDSDCRKHIAEVAFRVGSGIFKKADDIDRSGHANMGTAKMFYASSIFMETVRLYGEMTDDITERHKYAKFKTADIRKAIKEGRQPTPGPPGADPLEAEFNSMMDPAAPSPAAYQPPVYEPEDNTPPAPMPSASQPSAAQWTPPVYEPEEKPTPTYPAANAYPAAHSYQPAAPKVPAVPYNPSVSAPAGKLRNENYEAGQKFCKFAISAMQFEDPATAIKNLKLALHEMGTNV